MSKPLRVLIVEDSVFDKELLLRALRQQGYDVTYEAVDTAAGMRAALERQGWDLITSDHEMPNFDAPAALALAKELRSDAPFIIVSGEIDLNLAVKLIKSGAADYVQKQELIRLGPVIERELRDAKLALERNIAEDQLQESQALFRAIVENVGELVAVLDTEGGRLYNSPSYGPLFREQDIVRGSNSFLEIHPEDRERIKNIFLKTVTTGIGERAEFRFILKDGSIRHMESDGRAIRSVSGNVSKVVVVSRDITAQKHLEAELRKMAVTDPLTGLPNRRYFQVHLEQELERLHRIKGHSATVLMVDSDHFKKVNDTFGHLAGDHTLVHLASLMQNALRKIDTAGRIGGEEFAIILSGTDLGAAGVFAERLRLKVAGTPLAQNGREIPITVSIGVAEMTATDESAVAALDRADRALYRAKSAGRNRIEVFH